MAITSSRRSTRPVVGDSDDDQSRRASKKDKGKSKSNTNGPDEEDDEPDTDAIDPYQRYGPKMLDVLPQYLNQPLQAEQAVNKIKITLDEFAALRRNLTTTGELLSMVAEHLANQKGHEREDDLGEEEIPEDPIEIKKIELQYRQLLDKITELDIRHKTLSNLRQLIMQRHPMTDLFKRYDEQSEESIKAYDNQTDRQKYLNNPLWQSFRKLTWEQLYDGKPVPNLKNFLPAQEADAEDSDDEIEIGAQSSDFKCPLTSKLLDHPVTSNKCPHSFSRDAFIEYVGRKTVSCPVQGCPVKNMTMEDVHDDPGLKRRVEAFAKRQKQGGHSTQTAGTHSNKNGATQYEEVEDSDDDE